MAQGTSFLFVAALALATLPVPLAARTAVSAEAATPGPARGFADDALAPASIAEQQLGDAYLEKGELSPARDHFESALAADPRNRPAFLGLARIAEAQNLPGKAAHYYGEALLLEPDDQATLALQGMAYLRRGATRMAEDNLGKLKILCGAQSCPSAEKLASAITTQKVLPTGTAEKAASGKAAPGKAAASTATRAAPDENTTEEGKTAAPAGESVAPGAVTPD